LLQDRADVAHDALEFLRHVVERAVGVDDRVFKQAIGVDIGVQAGHCGLHWIARRETELTPTRAIITVPFGLDLARVRCDVLSHVVVGAQAKDVLA
jgi:hypothetical protein